MPDETQAAGDDRPEPGAPGDPPDASADTQAGDTAETPPSRADEDAAEMAEALLDQVHAAVSEANAPAGVPHPLPPNATPMDLPAFDSVGPRAAPAALDLLADVSLNVKIELGRTRMLVDDVLKLSDGAVVELDKLAGDPVDIYVNERHVARGEVLVLNDNFCVRINEIVDPDERKAG